VVKMKASMSVAKTIEEVDYAYKNGRKVSWYPEGIHILTLRRAYDTQYTICVPFDLWEAWKAYRKLMGNPVYVVVNPQRY